MDWTGAAHTKSCGYALLGIPAMVGTGTGREALGFLK